MPTSTRKEHEKLELRINTERDIKVKLTRVGMDIMKEHYAKFPKEAQENHSFDAYIKLDEDGYSTFSLGQLMHYFGPQMRPGRLYPFEDSLIVIPFN